MFSGPQQAELGWLGNLVSFYEHENTKLLIFQGVKKTFSLGDKRKMMRVPGFMYKEMPTQRRHAQCSFIVGQQQHMSGIFINFLT